MHGIAAYLDLQTAAWSGVELVMFPSHADGLSTMYGDGKTNDRDLLYRFLGRNYVFAIGFRKKDEKEQASPGDKIFIASVDAVGFGEIDEDGKLAVINKIMSYEQFFDDGDSKPMRGVLAVKLFILKSNAYRESAKDWKALVAFLFMVVAIFVLCPFSKHCH